MEFSKIYKYNTNDGRYCYISNDNEQLYLQVKQCRVVFDVDFSLNRPRMIVQLKDKDTIHFIEEFNKNVIKYVYENSNKIYKEQKSLQKRLKDLSLIYIM
jgi:hypothetical protein